MIKSFARQFLALSFIVLIFPNSIRANTDCATLLGEIAALLDNPLSREFPLPFHKKEIQDLIAKLSQLMPVTSAQRYDMVVGGYGPSVAPYVKYHGSNDNFAFNLVDGLQSQGELTKKENDDRYAIVKATELYQKGLQSLIKENKFPFAPTPLELISYEKLKELLSNPAASEFPPPFDKKEIHDLLKELALLLPVNPIYRNKLLSDIYGSFGTSFETVGSNTNFAFELVGRLGRRGRLTEKDTSGYFLIAKGIENFRMKYPTPSLEPKKTPHELMSEIERILESPEARKSPLFMGDPKIDRLSKILKETLPTDPEMRRLWVLSGTSESFAVNIDYDGSPEVFANKLINSLSRTGYLTLKENGSDYPLLKILFDL